MDLQAEAIQHGHAHAGASGTNLSVSCSSCMLDQTFASLADPTRRAIVQRLARGGELSVGEIAARFDASLPAIIKHIDVLEDAGLVVRKRRGRHVCCRIRPVPMSKARAWLDRNLAFWEAGLDRLQKLVDEDDA